jgi:cell division protein ZapA
MIKQAATASIEILGKTYQIKCHAHEVSSLQKAAEFLEEKMRVTRDGAGVLSIDRIAVITALNIAHQFLNLENLTG